jgi:hypothetical protein
MTDSRREPNFHSLYSIEFLHHQGEDQIEDAFPGEEDRVAGYKEAKRFRQRAKS